MGAQGRRRIRDGLSWDHQKQAYVALFRRLARVADSPLVDLTGHQGVPAGSVSGQRGRAEA